MITFGGSSFYPLRATVQDLEGQLYQSSQKLILESHRADLAESRLDESYQQVKSYEHQIAERAAMNQVFWCPAALYDDNGFDWLMQMSSMDELNIQQDWGGVFLHQYFQDRNIYDIKRMVWCRSVELLGCLCGISQDIAETLLVKTKTTDMPNGVYTTSGFN